jgi:copper(I)-binding protein
MEQRVGTMKRSAVSLLAVLMLAAAAARAAGVEVTGAWARATMPGQKVAGVYMEIRSDRAARLVGVESAAAGSAEVHEMRNDGGVMRMRHVEALDLPAGRTVKLAPGGFHVMLFELGQPLKPGDKVRLTLKVDRGGKREDVQVVAVVKPASAAGVDSGHGDH